MSVWFCEMKVRCPKFWADLKATDNKLVRDCDACGKQVNFIKSQEELGDAAMKGNCVAFYEDDLMPKHLVETIERIWEWNKSSSLGKRRMTVGLPSTSNRFSHLNEDIDSPVIPNINTAVEVEKVFKEIIKKE